MNIKMAIPNINDFDDINLSPRLLMLMIIMYGFSIICSSVIIINLYDGIKYKTV